MQSSNNLKEAFDDAVIEAKKLEKPPISEDTLIVYSGDGRVPALTLYLSLLHSGVRTILAPASLAAVSILPYRDVNNIIVFTSNDRDSRAINVLMAASSLGVNAILVSPRLHPAVEELVDTLGVRRISVEGPSPILVMMLATLYWRPKLYGFREERVANELDQIGTAIEWVNNNYEKEIEEISKTIPKTIYYTPIMEASAQYYAILVKGSVHELYKSLLLEERSSKPLILLSSVEEHNYKDILIGLTMRGVNPVKVTINTDPVTANLYGIILSILSTRRLA